MDWNKDKSVMFSRVCIIVFVMLACSGRYRCLLACFMVYGGFSYSWRLERRIPSYGYCVFMQHFCLDPAGEPMEASSQYTAGYAL